MNVKERVDFNISIKNKWEIPGSFLTLNKHTDEAIVTSSQILFTHHIATRLGLLLNEPTNHSDVEYVYVFLDFPLCYKEVEVQLKMHIEDLPNSQLRFRCTFYKHNSKSSLYRFVEKQALFDQITCSGKNIVISYEILIALTTMQPKKTIGTTTLPFRYKRFIGDAQTDAVLVMGDQRVRVHKDKLGSKSTVFYHYFLTKDLMVIDESKYDLMLIILRFIYHEIVPPSISPDLFALIDEFKLMTMRKVCELCIMTELTKLSSDGYYGLIYDLHDIRIISQTNPFLLNYMKTKFNVQEWLDLVQKNPIEFAKIPKPRRENFFRLIFFHSSYPLIPVINISGSSSMSESLTTSTDSASFNSVSTDATGTSTDKYINEITDGSFNYTTVPEESLTLYSPMASVSQSLSPDSVSPSSSIFDTSYVLSTKDRKKMPFPKHHDLDKDLPSSYSLPAPKSSSSSESETTITTASSLTRVSKSDSTKSAVPYRHISDGESD